MYVTCRGKVELSHHIQSKTHTLVWILFVRLGSASAGVNALGLELRSSPGFPLVTFPTLAPPSVKAIVAKRRHEIEGVIFNIVELDQMDRWKVEMN